MKMDKMKMYMADDKMKESIKGKMKEKIKSKIAMKLKEKKK